MKFMNLRRFGSIAMAGALTLSLAAPAFASSNNTTTITGGYEEIPISVSVPTTGTAQINPYGLPVNITKSDTITNVPITGQKITTRPLNIKNEGETALSVNASLLVVPKGDVIIQGAALTASEVGKEIDVQLEVAGLDDAKYGVSSLSTTLEDDLLDAFAADATWASANSLRAPANTVGGSATAAKSNSAMAVLGAATVQTGGLITYGNDSIALFRLTGDLNKEPNDGASPAVDTPWDEDDGFTATVVFKFAPAEAASVTLNKTSTTIASGASDSLTAVFSAGDTSRTAASYAWTTSDATVATVTGSSTTGSVSYAGSGTATITCTATLDDGSTVSATCKVTCS